MNQALGKVDHALCVCVCVLLYVVCVAVCVWLQQVYLVWYESYQT